MGGGTIGRAVYQASDVQRATPPAFITEESPMGHPISNWKNKTKKKLASRTYVGTYHYDVVRTRWVKLRSGKKVRRKVKEREFVLTCKLRSGRTHRMVFESHELAKKDGWRKVNK